MEHVLIEIISDADFIDFRLQMLYHVKVRSHTQDTRSHRPGPRRRADADSETHTHTHTHTPLVRTHGSDVEWIRESGRGFTLCGDSGCS